GPEERSAGGGSLQRRRCASGRRQERSHRHRHPLSEDAGSPENEQRAAEQPRTEGSWSGSGTSILPFSAAPLLLFISSPRALGLARRGRRVGGGAEAGALGGDDPVPGLGGPGWD